MNIQNIDLFEMHEPLTGSFPFAALTAVLPDDISSVSIHWQDTMEILLIREGTGQVSIDLEKISVKKGDICLILPGQLHSIDADSSSSLKISMIQFPLSLLSGSTDNDDAFAFLNRSQRVNKSFHGLSRLKTAGTMSFVNVLRKCFSCRRFIQQLTRLA